MHFQYTFLTPELPVWNLSVTSQSTLVQMLYDVAVFRCLRCPACQPGLVSTTLTSTWSWSKWKACSDRKPALFLRHWPQLGSRSKWKACSDQSILELLITEIICWPILYCYSSLSFVIHYFHVCTVEAELTYAMLFMIISCLTFSVIYEKY